jgi:hypothetical protein
MAIRTFYPNGGTAIGVEDPYVHVAPHGSDYPHFAIVCVPSERLSRYGELDCKWINECVAVDGRVPKLLEANLDEVSIEGAAAWAS